MAHDPKQSVAAWLQLNTSICGSQSDVTGSRAEHHFKVRERADRDRAIRGSSL